MLVPVPSSPVPFPSVILTTGSDRECPIHSRLGGPSLLSTRRVPMREYGRRRRLSDGKSFGRFCNFGLE